MPVKTFFVPVKKISKKPVSARENDKLGVKKVKKVRKSRLENLKLHVKKYKKRSKIGFLAHFRFHAKKKTLGSNSAREKRIPTRENSEKYARENDICTREKISRKAGKCPSK